MFFKRNNKLDIELCKAEIKRHEGEVLEIYIDSLGYKTLASVKPPSANPSLAIWSE